MPLNIAYTPAAAFSESLQADVTFKLDYVPYS